MTHKKYSESYKERERNKRKKKRRYDFLKAYIEISKCVLLCSNCHAEIHENSEFVIENNVVKNDKQLPIFSMSASSWGIKYALQSRGRRVQAVVADDVRE